MTENKKPDFSNVQSGASSTAPPPSSAPKPTAPAAQVYTVAKGDNLSKIAKHFYGNANEWKRIFEANRDVLKDPDKIFPGQQLKSPAES
jgi:nucleoid-associated protein YgaU